MGSLRGRFANDLLTCCMSLGLVNSCKNNDNIHKEKHKGNHYRSSGFISDKVHMSLYKNTCVFILGLESISRDVAYNASQPRRLDSTVELTKYSFVLYLQHSRHDVKCKPAINIKLSCFKLFKTLVFSIA